MLLEQELQLLQWRFYEDILNFIPSDIAVFDTAHRYLFINPVAVSDPAIREWLIGKTDADYFALKGKSMEIPQRRSELFNQILRTKADVEWEEELTNKEGQKENHLRKMHPILDEDGNVRMVIGFGMKITERKKIEEHVQRSEKRYRDLFNYSQALITTHDLKGILLSVNPAVENALHYSREEMIGKSINDFVPLEKQSLFNSNYLDIIIKNGKAHGVFSVISKAGKKIYLLYQNYKVEEPGSEPYIIGFSQDITQRILTEQELLQTKKMTEEASKAKETFLANMSHEIRTPMNGVLGIAGLLAKTGLSAQQKNYVQLIQDSANHLLVIINDILDLEKIEAGRMQLEEIPFNIPEKILTAIQSFTFKAEERGIQLVYKNHLPSNLHVKGDPYRLTQVLNNFLGNAVKFTEKGGITIDTKVKFDKEEWAAIEFLVVDTGIGIPQDKLGSIFDPFVQANTNTTRKYGGTGLGLSICKNLIEMQGGELWVESEVNKGTEFRFIIPYKRYEAPILQQELQQAIDYKSLGRRKALVAEDVELNQFLAKHIMESWGFEVVIADNGRIATGLLEKRDFDFILMDIQMPEMDGIQATQYIRRMVDPNKAAIPIIALTANALKGDSEKYLEAGMNDYLSKPFTEEQLFTVIKRTLKTQVMGNNNEENSSEDQPISESKGSASLYDLTMVRSVSGGDEGFIKKMVHLFIQTVPPAVADLNEATQSKQWERIGKVAHKLKSTIDSMGISSLKEDIRAIEANGKNQQQLETIEPLVQKVTQVVNQCILQLKTDYPL